MTTISKQDLKAIAYEQSDGTLNNLAEGYRRICAATICGMLAVKENWDFHSSDACLAFIARQLDSALEMMAQCERMRRAQ